MTIKQYLADSGTYEGEMTIVGIVAGERPAIRTAQTWFHPQGGGQKPDRGQIGPAAVVHVAHNGSEVDHFVNDIGSLKEGDTYRFQVDRAWRALNSRYHSAGHLLASVVEARCKSLRAVSGHQWPGEARVEFEGSWEDLSELSQLAQHEVDDAINQDLPVVIIGDPHSDRAIRIGDYQPIPCGGTHVARTSQIGAVRVEGVKRKSGRIRLSYKTE